MSFSDCDCAEDKEAVDCRLRQHWARKARRHSSEWKSFMGDSLELSEHQRVTSYLVKNGESTAIMTQSLFHVIIQLLIVSFNTTCTVQWRKR